MALSRVRIQESHELKKASPQDFDSQPPSLGENPRRKARAILSVAIPLVTVGIVFYFFARIAHLSQGQAGPPERSLLSNINCPPNWQKQAAAYEKKQQESFSYFLSALRLSEIDKANDLLLWKTPKGLFWTDSKDRELNELPWELASIENGLYDEEGASVRQDDVVLDCGAHFGSFTRHALDRGAQLVVAIEFDPTSIVCLNRTFRAEIANRKVIVYPKGVWDKDDQLVLYRAEKSGSSNVVQKDKNTGIVVQLTTIDAIAHELQLSRIDFIKMDIEGSEQKAIIGAQDTADKSRILGFNAQMLAAALGQGASASRRYHVLSSSLTPPAYGQSNNSPDRRHLDAAALRYS
jgi:FkbM family methyltransferase